MLRCSLMGLLLCCTATPAWASSWADALFDEVARDFGSVPRGPVLTHPFRVVNKTKDTVHISSLRASCGCTSARALQSTLAPGQETAIVVQMDTRRFFSTKNVTIYVQFDQPHFGEVRLWVQASSRDDVAVMPDALAFGRIKRGSSPSTRVAVSFLGNAQWQIMGARCDSNYIQLSYQEVRRDDAEVAYQVSARVRPDAPAGKWYSDVWLATNNSTMPKVRLPLTVEIESPLSLNPQTVVLGMVKAGTETDRKVIVRGIRPFRITGITGTDHQVRVRDISSESRTVHVLTVTLHPTSAGMLTRSIRVRTDMNSGTDIEFNAKAHVVP